MKYKQNLHTHSCYCDGEGKLEEIVLSAIEKGFDSVGFSSHSNTSFDERYCMAKDDEEKYYSECRHLREKYRGIIDVLCGIEQDIYSPPPKFDYDYVIGSVHYIRCRGKYISVDTDAEILTEAVRKYFGGDVYSLAEEYYLNVEKVVEKTNCDIIGHFDVISKFSEKGTGLIDVKNEKYLEMGRNSIKKLITYGKIFEINSGAVARGYRSEPYPAHEFLSLIQKLGGRVTLSSDCHRKDRIDFGFEEMKKAAVSAGFKSISVLINGRFENAELF